MLVMPSKLWSQTCSMIIVRDKTRPALDIKYSRRAYSLSVSSMRLPARFTCCDRRSSSRSSTRTTLLRVAGPRLNSAFARTSNSAKAKGLVGTFEAGADDYLTKPFAFAELLVRAKALLRRGPATRSSVVRVDDLELDRLSQQVKRAGRRIELTLKEYALLEYLMSNAGRVLSRTMIIEHVWDQSFDGITNIVDVYVRHLRSKVDDGHEHKLIRTVRGVGYTISSGAQS